MFRSPPPRGRFRRLLLLAAFVGSALVAPPAGAAEPAPTEFPTATIPAVVNGLEPLRIPLPAGAAELDVVVVDRNDAVARWAVPAGAADDGGFISVDLAAPDEGPRPYNGLASVTVSAGEVVVTEGWLLIDLDPSAPRLTAKGQDAAAVLSWDPVSGPGAVTYRVQRQDASGAWATVTETSEDRYVDQGLEPGRYAYRLSALVAAASDGHNESTPSSAAVRVLRPLQPPTAEPTTTPLPEPPAPAPPPKPEARAVAATGRISEGITPLRVDQRVPRRKRPRLSHSPVSPPLGGIRSMPRGVAGPVLAPPPTAAPAPAPTAAAAPRELLPVAVPPAGTLMIDAGGGPAQHRLLVRWAAALLLLVGAMQLVVALQRRRRQLGGGRSPVST